MSCAVVSSDSSLLNVITEQSLGCALTVLSCVELHSIGSSFTALVVGDASLSLCVSTIEKSINAADSLILDIFDRLFGCGNASIGNTEQPVSGSSSGIADNSRVSATSSIADEYA